uniref:Uncharacterized protein n=1 Tax=Kwoniella bestiolae CBS 10118 TaxID=1296100 RepID=A0A1B9G273_9TREE|nr:hypothetical protein I302_04930 [Kwoniella bestiolae CBS 10118]OCF25120.1 hypothetical protein I302_04930 [Kwoniella bestiolae CBS 10118]
MWLKLLLLGSVILIVAHSTFATPLGQMVLQSGDNPLPLANPHAETSGIGITTEKVLFYDLDDIQYFTPYHHPSHTFHTTIPLALGERFTPLVVIPITKPFEGIVTVQHLQPLVESYLREDDVLTRSFFGTVLLHPEDGIVNYNIEVSALVYLMREMDTKTLLLDERLSINLPAPGIGLPSLNIKTIPPHSLKDGIAGPFIARSSSGRDDNDHIELFPVYRLYTDYYRTFASGIYPLNDGKGAYKVLGKVDKEGNQMIPVPSRLYAKGSNKPLAGERAGVKDIYDIKGIPTSAGSRTYLAWRGEVNATASAIRKLEAEGAVIVGKAKTVAQMLNVCHDNPNSPFSPRGDLYQSYGSSSSGSSCALAAYDWLDFTVGSDTGGSVRGPAAVAGLYGNKPSQGLISLDGVVPLLKWTDTAGILTRSPSKFKKVLDVWYEDSQANRRHNHLPKTLLVPSDDFPGMPDNIRSIVMKTLQDIERTLGMRVEMINQTANHPHKHPDTGGFMTVDMFSQTMYAWQWKYLAEKIVQWYKSENGGRFPPVGTKFQDRWREYEDHPWTDEDFDKMKERQEKTAEWFNGMIGRDEETCSSNIYVDPFPLDTLPVYREEKLNNISESFMPRRRNPLFAYAPASISGAPEYVVPIGQVPFKSLVSGVEEMHPLSMSFIAYPGCDSMLLDFIDKLGKAGILNETKTGRTAF